MRSSYNGKRVWMRVDDKCLRGVKKKLQYLRNMNMNMNFCCFALQSNKRHNQVYSSKVQKAELKQDLLQSHKRTLFVAAVTSAFPERGEK